MTIEQQNQLVGFVKDILSMDINGDLSDVQFYAEKHGLMRLEIRTTPCNECCVCQDFLFGNEKSWGCYSVVEWLKNLDVENMKKVV